MANTALPVALQFGRTENEGHRGPYTFGPDLTRCRGVPQAHLGCASPQY
jgi:hypothetical protein